LLSHHTTRTPRDPVSYTWGWSSLGGSGGKRVERLGVGGEQDANVLPLGLEDRARAVPLVDPVLHRVVELGRILLGVPRRLQHDGDVLAVAPRAIDPAVPTGGGRV